MFFGDASRVYNTTYIEEWEIEKKKRVKTTTNAENRKTYTLLNHKTSWGFYQFTVIQSNRYYSFR